MTSHRPRSWTALAGAAALVCASAALTGRDADSQDAPRPSLNLAELSGLVEDAARRARPAVVTILVQQRLALEGEPFTHTLSLSGTVWDDEGGIVTFGHGLQSAESVEVQLADAEERIPARLIGIDAETDIALLRAELGGRARALPRIPAERREAVKPGALVVTVGNPFGLTGSARLANISGVGRAVSTGRITFEDALELTAPVNPGDPGGLVANARGELIGLMASSLRNRSSSLADEAMSELLKQLKKTPDGGRELLFAELQRRAVLSSAQSIGFAIPVSAVEAAVERIAIAAKSPKVWLGVHVVPVPEGWREQLEIPDGEGILVTGVVVDSPARKAGLQSHDIILRWNEAKVSDVYALRDAVLAAKPGDAVEIVLLREGERLTRTVTLQARSGE